MLRGQFLSGAAISTRYRGYAKSTLRAGSNNHILITFVNMKRRLFILLSVAVLGLAVWLLYIALRPALPSYQEQSLEVWFRKLPPTFPEGYGSGVLVTKPGGFLKAWDVERYGLHYGTTNRTLNPTSAIQNMGTNCLPYLIAKLSRRESRLVISQEKAAFKLGVRPLFRDPGVERAQALTALIVLSPLPPKTVAEVQRLTTSRDTNVAVLAKFLLEFATGEKPTQISEWY